MFVLGSELYRIVHAINILEEHFRFRFIPEEKACIVDIPKIVDRFEIRGTVLKPGLFVVTHEDVCKGGAEG